jgi:MFS family permease
MIIVGIALHGICYDFFFVTGQVYVDKKSTPAIRGQAQGMLVLVTYGLGMLIGAQTAGRLFNTFLGDAGALTLGQWQQFWFVPAAFAAVIMVGFALLFNDRVDQSRAKAANDEAAAASPTG